MTNRQQALDWWRGLQPVDRAILTTCHVIGFRKPESLTGREIERIYKEKHKP